jgi:hypothetical protein
MWCRRLDADTFSNPEVKATLQELVPLRLNGEKGGKALAERYGVTGYPTVVFTDSKGEEVERVAGYLPPDKFLAEVRRIRSGDTFAACLNSLVDDPGDHDALKRAVEGLLERSDPEGAIARIVAFHEVSDDAELEWCHALLFKAKASLHQRLYERAGKLYRKGWPNPLEVPGSEAGQRLKALLGEGLLELDAEEQKRRLREARHLDAATLLEQVSAEGLNAKELFKLASFADSNGHYDQAAELYERWYEIVGEEADSGALNEAAWALYLSNRGVEAAVDMARSALAETDSPMIADTLARLLYIAGSVDEAIAIQTRAAEQVKGENAADELRRAMELMVAGEPLGDSPRFEQYPG